MKNLKNLKNPLKGGITYPEPKDSPKKYRPRVYPTPEDWKIRKEEVKA